MATTEEKAMLRSGAVLVGLGMGLSLGCLSVRPDPDHCANLEGNRTCEDRYLGERTFCTACGSTPGQDGCVAQRPEEDACYSPCGDQTRLEDDATCLADTSSSSGEESTSTGEETGTESSSSESSTTGPMPCEGNEDCPDTAAPLCEPVSGECVTCDAFGAEGDAACAGLDAANPVCLAGACVQCTAAAPEACTGTTPVCDDATSTCGPCTAHDQCTGEAACNLFTGACLPSDAVVHVGPGQTYTTIGAAVSSFDMMTEGTIIVHQANYDEAVTVDGGRVLTLLANAGDTPIWVLPGGGAPQLTVGDGTVLLDGLRLSGNADDVGLVLDGGQAWVDRSRIVQNTGGGIVAQNAAAELVVRNCFVGGDESDVDAVMIDGATASVLYTTVGGGNGSFGMAHALSCTAGSDVTIRNSVLAALDDIPELACSTATVSYSASETAIAGTANVTLGPVQAGWFAGYSTGDFTLASPSVQLTNAAQWQDGDPPTDIHGDLRPTIDGTSDCAGADVP